MLKRSVSITAIVLSILLFACEGLRGEQGEPGEKENKGDSFNSGRFDVALNPRDNNQLYSRSGLLYSY